MDKKPEEEKPYIDTFYEGKYCIVRTYSAGVWFGKVIYKDGNQIILNDAHRLYYWKTKKGISLSEIALYGLDDSKSKICFPVDDLWLVPIELIPVTLEAFNSIKLIKPYEN